MENTADFPKDEKASFEEEAKKWRNWFYSGQKVWSVAHHVSTYGAILCSVAAVGLLQIESLHHGWPTLFTTAAATLGSIASAGGFQRKWRSNRLSRGKVDGLLIDTQGKELDLPDLRKQLKAIITAHDQQVVEDESKGLSQVAKPKEDTKRMSNDETKKTPSPSVNTANPVDVEHSIQSTG